MSNNPNAKILIGQSEVDYGLTDAKNVIKIIQTLGELMRQVERLSVETAQGRAFKSELLEQFGAAWHDASVDAHLANAIAALEAVELVSDYGAKVVS